MASGKGGTGKSFLASNLAIAMHRLGRRVCVVDCDFGLANAHLLFGVNPGYTMQHLLDGVATAEQVVSATPHGPSLVAGGSGIAAMAELGPRHMQALARALHQIAAAHEVVLLDCGAGLAPQSLITVLAAPHAVVVTNPEIAALTDAYALVKCLVRQGACPEVHLVVNRVVQPGMGQQACERLQTVSSRFVGCDIHYLGEVPEDPAVSFRRLGQPPLLSLPECATSRAVMGIARAMLELEGDRGRPTSSVEARMMAQIRRW
ncbi:MAG: P-loop NTPase [Planctomycetes bacterium]|nr:P-loop NTPase [Planctomycetota bacterium]